MNPSSPQQSPSPTQPGTNTPCSVFVYGTLKRGEVREHCWPVEPKRVTACRVRGTLFDLGPYPALCHGDEWVEGERWQFSPDAPHDLLSTLTTLDAIEGYQQPHSEDLYRREVVDCWDLEDDTVRQAYTYFFADPDSLRATVRQVNVNQRGAQVWSPRPGQRHLDD